MAVMQNSIIFGGVDSADFGIYIGGEGTFDAPKRDVEMISIPGRNGAFALDKGRFQNIEVTYSAFNHEPDLATFSAQLEGFRNAICSQKGYQRLTDTFHPDEYRMAAYIDGLEIKPIEYNTAATFDIKFDCKPQRYLLSGEEPITIGEWHETETASGEIASFEAKEGDAVKSLLADIEPIQSLNGYDKPWSGGAGKNKLPPISGATSNGITLTNNNGVYTLSGTSTATALFDVSFPTALPIGTYAWQAFNATGDANVTMYLLASSGSNPSLQLNSVNRQNVITTTATMTTFRLRVASGVTLSNFKLSPTLVSGSEYLSAFEPYTNICPISGYDSVVVNRTGKNLLDVDNAEIGTAWNGASNSARARLVIELKLGQAYTLKANGTSSVDLWYGVLTDTIPPSSAGGVLANPWTFTATKKYLSLGFNKTAITKADIEALKLQLELGSTATDYEPYNGTTYVIDLNGTRYGGTLDIVSGVLTVTHVAVDLGSLTWEVWPGYTSIFRCGLPSGCKTVGNQGVPNWLCSAYVVTSGVSVSSTIGSIGQLHASYVLANNPSYTDASAFKTAMTGQTLVYELATPTTVQLTAQEVELLVGLNQVWANSGDVEVEYGTAPNVVYNPTLFESSPMLEVEGYGAININDEVVSIQNEELGTIKISGSSGSGSSMSLDTTQLNNGDTIFYNSAPYMVVKVKAISGNLHITRNGAPTGGSCSISRETSNITYVQVRPSETTFSKGTNKTVTTSVPLYVSADGTTTSCTLTLTTSYTASTGKITLSASWTSAPDTIIKTSEYRHHQYYGNSTKSLLPSPMYIDLDIGEAYGVIDGEPLSFDNIVTLPAELPKLKSGANTITADNTITDLKVVPRYWRI